MSNPLKPTRVRRLVLALAALPPLTVTAADAPEAATDGAPTVTAWVVVATENQPFHLSATQHVRYGDGGVHWLPERDLSGDGTCSNGFFGGDPAPWQAKFCEVQKTVPAVRQIPGQMPVVNPALMPATQPGYTEPRARTLTADERRPGSPYLENPTNVGAFRVPCGSYARVSADDPIVFPGQPGKSHLHTFLGNTAADAFSTPDSLLAGGGSTCAGGTLNRTAYWMPSMIDTRTGQPILPVGSNFYYKLGYLGVKAGTVQPFPKGLRMIAGDARNAAPVGSPNRFSCLAGGASGGDGAWHAEIPACGPGGDLVVSVSFPQCWDGKNLDSPDHKSHMAFGTGKGCPADHPVPLPEITQNVHYHPRDASGTANWRLSSDNYAGPGGYSLHSDWMGAWDVPTMKKFVDNCLNGNKDCHDYILGDGTIIY
ncbi:MAG: DUF1996 domain-containing protein [Pseudomonadota bacterium]|nr:DUF1996 domain-containing protein [Pseudomonadota bacterium]